MPPVVALAEAAQRNLDLVPVAPTACPPVYRLAVLRDVEASRREKEKAARRRDLERRRKDTQKEVRIGAKTAAHDMAVKLGKVREFLSKGHRVKATVIYSRSESRAEAKAKMDELVDELQDCAAVTLPAVNERVVRNAVSIYLTAVSSDGDAD
ncbi:hypothetical protein WJX72_000037 [[Myrmecia] bisecta]|uniref:Translation initiation factor 3 C-terminal domain-containing protein n=1 Tax=[Myrmecia] bisecta TaxID=41462 RepID=A0AAW1R3X4_9CHLO